MRSYLLLALFAVFSLGSALVIEKADREFDVSGHLLKINDKLLVLGEGSATTEFDYYLASDLGDKVVYFDVSSKAGDKRERLTFTEKKESGKKLWKIKLAQSLGNNERVNIQVSIVFRKALQPYPREIKQSEKQKTIFTGNLHIFSPYVVKTESVRFSLASSQIESYTKVRPFSVSDNVINYGPYENLKAFTENEVSVHFENNTPFLVARKLNRLVEVSLWGSNIAVEEHYEIYHAGAEHQGAFSRYDYQIHQDGVSSIKSFKTVLPAAARDIYYRDEIGNISTSNVRQLSDAVEVEIRPRFPLFGGWKTIYYIGYNVPAHQFLYRTSGHFALRMPFIDHVYDDQLIEEVTLKVVLPESAEILKFFPPYSVERKANEVRNVYFDFTDTIKRPIFVAEAKNLVEQHIQDFTLEFSFNSMFLYRQPILFMTAAFTLFLAVIVMVRMDFAITRDEAAEARMKASSHWDAVTAQVKIMRNNYDAFTVGLSTFKSTKDITAFQQLRKRTEQAWKGAQEELNAIRATMKTESPESAEKVHDLIRQDTLIHESLYKQQAALEKFVSGKTDKSRFTSEEDSLRGQTQELYNRFDNAAALFA